MNLFFRIILASYLVQVDALLALGLGGVYLFYTHKRLEKEDPTRAEQSASAFWIYFKILMAGFLADGFVNRDPFMTLLLAFMVFWPISEKKELTHA